MSDPYFEDDEKPGLFGEGSRLKTILIGLAAAAGIMAALLIGFVVWCYQDLPSQQKLAEYQPPVTTRVYAGDGSLIAEFADEQRVYVPSAAIPDRVKNAFISAEDKNFRTHGGIDLQGLMRATLRNVASIFTGDRMQGASTITQQVAKNMLLTSDRTLTRKVKEAFLAQRIEKAFSKERILELYLNEIYLGARSYGVAAASLNYFNKPLDQLTISEAAYLGGLPKGPENYNPSKHMERAIDRRNYVIARMEENKYITAEEAASARDAKLVTVNRLSGDKFVASAHYVEELRRQLLKMYKEDGLYKGGLSVRSTLDTRLQIAAAASLRQGLDAYDRRHGWRGPLKRVDAGKDMAAAMKDVPSPPGASGWFKAYVTNASAKAVNITLEDGREGALANEDIQWAARGAKKNQLSAGSIVYVQPLKNSKTKYGLRQVPAVEGAIVAMDPHTGRVLAMVGGYAFKNSQFNRVTQAMRQPGSSFKPIVYAAALDNGLTPSTLVEDAPFQIEAGDGTIYNPENYSKEFYGPSTLRTGIEKSRNAMTVRLAYEMGMQPIVDYAKKLGVNDNLMPVLAMSLGAGETTLMRMTGAYATFVNGGKKVTPTLIDRVQDRTGKTTFKSDQRACQGCLEPWSGQSAPDIADTREQILDPITSYQITSMLEGVVLRGTGTAIQSVGKPLAGKTGTTNDYKDAWFVGFSPDLVVGVWMGFDQPKSMGEGETGGTMAAPVFRDFMKIALEGADANTFRAPPNVRFVRIDGKTGYLPTPESTGVILEAYKPGTEPVRDVDTSTFVYGGGEAIDPRQLQGLEAPVQEGVVAQSEAPPVNLGTVDDGEGGLF